MKLYLISQSENNGYDTYDSAVVCAPSEEVARSMYPSNGSDITSPKNKWDFCDWIDDPSLVAVEYLGDAEPNAIQRVICASFNAG